MDLKTFVSDVLVQITEGIGEANQKLFGDKLARYDSSFCLGRTTGNDKNKPIQFDVAVIVKKDKKIEGKGKLKIPLVSVAGGADKTSINEQVSRVKFEISIPEKLTGKP